MKNIVIIITVALLSLSVNAQQTQKKIRFSSVNQVGVLTGSHKDAFMMQTINGISYGKWSTGIGVGIDGYSERSIPLFIDVRKSFLKGDYVPFVYVDGGINFGWLNFIQRENLSFPEYEQPSWYYDTGLGWKVPLGNKSSILFSAGYTLKQLSGYRIRYAPRGAGLSTEYEEEFENTYRRIVIKMGIQL